MFYKWLQKLYGEAVIFFTMVKDHFFQSENEDNSDVDNSVISDSLKLAITHSNEDGFNKVIAELQSKHNKIFLTDNSEEFLKLCYIHANFQFAEKLINVGAEFKSKYISYVIRKKVALDVMTQHIDIIKPNITEKEFINSKKVVNAMSFNLKIVAHESADFKTWFKITYTDNQKYFGHFSELYKGFANDDNPLITCAFHFVNHINSDKNNFQKKVKILSPIFESQDFSAFHNGKLELVYAPFSDFSQLERAILLHELGHYMASKGFNNGDKPFQKGNITQMKEYDLAATNVLCKIGKLIKFKCNSKNTENLKSVGVAYELLDKSSITLFHYNSMLQNEKYGAKLTNQVLDTIITKFNISHSLIGQFGAIEAIRITVDKMTKDLKLTPDLLIIVERMGEYISRADENKYLSELFPRLLEFIGMGLGEEALSNVQPLAPFFLKNLCAPDNEITADIYKDPQQENTANIELTGKFIEEEL